MITTPMPPRQGLDQPSQTSAGYPVRSEPYPYAPMVQSHPPPHFRASGDSTHHGSREFITPHGHQYSAGFQGQGHRFSPSMYAPQPNLPQNLAPQGFVRRDGTSLGADAGSVMTTHSEPMRALDHQSQPQTVKDEPPETKTQQPPQTNNEPLVTIAKDKTVGKPKNQQPTQTNAQNLRVAKEQARLATDMIPSQGVMNRRDEEASKVTRSRPTKPPTTQRTPKSVTKAAGKTIVKAEDTSSDDEEPIRPRKKPAHPAGCRGGRAARKHAAVPDGSTPSRKHAAVPDLEEAGTYSDEEDDYTRKKVKKQGKVQDRGAPQKDPVKNKPRAKAGTTDEEDLDSPLFSPPADPSNKVKRSTGAVPAAGAGASKHLKKGRVTDASMQSSTAAAAASPSGGGTDRHKGGKLRAVCDEQLSPWTESVIVMKPNDKDFQAGAIAAGELCHNYAGKCYAI